MPGTTITLFQKLLTAMTNKHVVQARANLPYLPAPLVGLLLKSMHAATPSAFIPLRILIRGIGGTICANENTEHQFVIWLPALEEPSDQASIKALLSGTGTIWNATADPYRLIARYAAAMVIGGAVSYAPKEIILDYYSAEVREYWGELIDAAIAENGGSLMQVYSTEIGCEPTIFHCASKLKTLPISPVRSIQDRTRFVDKHILGIDIGGTSVRIGKYKVSDFSLVGNEIVILANAVAAARNQQTWTADDFVKHLLGYAGVGPLFDDTIIAVGVSLAAPVGKETGRPLARSGALETYFGVTSIATANPIDIHKIDLATAIKSVFRSKTWPIPIPIPTVKVLNDGDADIADADDVNRFFADNHVEENDTCPEGITVELKAGTGIAIAVHKNGKHWQLSAESAKAIMNLLATSQTQHSINQRFQEGPLSHYVSKNGLKKLTDNILFGSGVFFDNPGMWLGSILEDLLCGSDKTTKIISYNLTHFITTLALFTVLNKANQCLDDLYLRAYLIILLQQNITQGDIVQQVRDDILAELRARNPAPPSMIMGQPPTLPPIKTSATLTGIETYAIGTAWLLGRWLADAIALIVDLFNANEIRLAGGPLSGATGIFVAAAAERALQDVYGYELEVIWDTRLDSKGKSRNSSQPSSPQQRLRLVYPPAETLCTNTTVANNVGSSGTRGAAKAAFADWVIDLKQQQLLQCRDWVYSQPSGTNIQPSAMLQKLSTSYSISVTEDEVAAMLEREAAFLNLTRNPNGSYTKHR